MIFSYSEAIEAGSSEIPSTAFNCGSGVFLYGSIGGVVDQNPHCFPETIFLTDGESIGKPLVDPLIGTDHFVTIIDTVYTERLQSSSFSLAKNRITCSNTHYYNSYGIEVLVLYRTYIPFFTTDPLISYNKFILVCVGRTVRLSDVW